MPDPQDQQQQPWEKYGNSEDRPWAKYSAPAKDAAVQEFTGEESLRDAPLNVLEGAGKGALNTVSNIGKLITDPFTSKESIARSDARLKSLTQPKGLAQNVGFGGEQAAEFFLPGGLEEHAGELAGQLPKVGKFARPLARMAAGAFGTGAIEKAHGGSFESGAELGGVMGAGSELARAAAPSIAESALGITKRQRGFGKTPGQAILEDTRGIRPATIARTAGQKIGALTGELENNVNASQGLARTTPALQVIDAEMRKAVRQNNRAYFDQLQDIRNQLTTEFHSGNPIPSITTPRQILDLKRGVQKLEKSWNPEQQGLARGTVRRVGRALDTELDTSVPEAADLNQRISSLIEAEKGAKSTTRGATLGQRMAHRIGAHTGALAGSVAGGAMGYERGGTPGAAIGGTIGLVAPELLASPTAQMGAARLMRSPLTGRIVRSIAAPLLLKGENDTLEDENPR